MNGKHFAELYNKFHNGDRLTNEELLLFRNNTRELVDFYIAIDCSLMARQFMLDLHSANTYILNRNLQ